MCVKLRRKLDEFASIECAAGFVSGMIAPHTQRHAIARIGESKFTIRLLFARQLWARTFHLHMHAPRHRASACARRGAANFCERH